MKCFYFVQLQKTIVVSKDPNVVQSRQEEDDLAKGNHHFTMLLHSAVCPFIYQPKRI